MIYLIGKIKCRKINVFQSKIKIDTENTKKSKKIWVRADKLNIYKISPSNFHRILQNKINDTYKVNNSDTLSQINNNTVKFARKLHIYERMGKFVKKKVLIFYSVYGPWYRALNGCPLSVNRMSTSSPFSKFLITVFMQFWLVSMSFRSPLTHFLHVFY